MNPRDRPDGRGPALTDRGPGRSRTHPYEARWMVNIRRQVVYWLLRVEAGERLRLVGGDREVVIEAHRRLRALWTVTERSAGAGKRPVEQISAAGDQELADVLRTYAIRGFHEPR